MLLIATIVVILLLVIYYKPAFLSNFYTKTPATSANASTGAGTNALPMPGEGEVIPQGEPDPPTTVGSPGKVGVWARNTSYSGGYTYDGAKYLCGAYNNRLATREEVDRAGRAGLFVCQSGWYDGQGQGWYSNGVDKACGQVGWNTLPNVTTSTKLSNYCYGVIPNSADVLKSVII